MKKIKYIFIIGIGILSLSACNDEILNKQPLDMITDQAVWKDKDLIDSYLTQCYVQMSIFSNEAKAGTGLYNGESSFAIFTVNEVSDECTGLWPGGTIEFEAFKFGTLNVNGGLLEWWEDAYSVIRKLNEFIDKVPASPLDENTKKERIAEARFLRAFNYFSMVKRYGGVPLITKVQQTTDSQESLYPRRDTEQAVYDYVLSELDAIANDLPEKIAAQDLGRPSKYTALALKCRAALYAGSIAQFGTLDINGVVGIDPAKSADYYQASYDAAMLIINSKNYALYNADVDRATNFRNLFLKKDNPEVIFAKKHDYNEVSGGVYDFFQCPAPQAWGGGNSDGPYLQMVEEFEHIDGTSGKLDRVAVQQGLWTTAQLWANKDPRFFATFYTQDTQWKGAPLDFHNGLILPNGTLQTDKSYQGVLAQGNQRMNGTGFGVLKYLEESKDNMGKATTSGTDYIIFRYAEVLLNLAEAANELGKYDEALDAINQIRTRAGIVSLASIDETSIRHERKVELAFEGHRYWDARRWRTAVNDFSISMSGIQYVLDYNTRKYKIQIINDFDGKNRIPKFYEKNYYLPINFGRIGSNKNLVENPGY